MTLIFLGGCLAVAGWMLKTGNLTGWAKLKVENTIDLVVIGVNAGKGKYKGLIGSLICGVWFDDLPSAAFIPPAQRQGILAVADVGGMNDETREQMTHGYEYGGLLNTVIECKYQNVDSKGRLRHPRFLRCARPAGRRRTSIDSSWRGSRKMDFGRLGRPTNSRCCAVRRWT